MKDKSINRPPTSKTVIEPGGGPKLIVNDRRLNTVYSKSRRPDKGDGWNRSYDSIYLRVGRNQKSRLEYWLEDNLTDNRDMEYRSRL